MAVDSSTYAVPLRSGTEDSRSVCAFQPLQLGQDSQSQSEPVSRWLDYMNLTSPDRLPRKQQHALPQMQISAIHNPEVCLQEQQKNDTYNLLHFNYNYID
jgi:hypothetical protein